MYFILKIDWLNNINAIVLSLVSIIFFFLVDLSMNNNLFATVV